MSAKSKSWKRSRTLIVNGTFTILSLITLLAGLFAGPELAALGVSAEVARWAAGVGLVASAINAWLRTQTGQPIAGTRAARRP